MIRNPENIAQIKSLAPGKSRFHPMRAVLDANGRQMHHRRNYALTGAWLSKGGRDMFSCVDSRGNSYWLDGSIFVRKEAKK